MLAGGGREAVPEGETPQEVAEGSPPAGKDTSSGGNSLGNPRRSKRTPRNQLFQTSRTQMRTPMEAEEGYESPSIRYAIRTGLRLPTWSCVTRSTQHTGQLHPRKIPVTEASLNVTSGKGRSVVAPSAGQRTGSSAPL